MEDEEKLLICSIAFWKTQTRPPIQVIKALLACFVLLSSSLDKTVHYVKKNNIILCHYISGGYRTWLSDRQSEFLNGSVFTEMQ